MLTIQLVVRQVEVPQVLQLTKLPGNRTFMQGEAPSETLIKATRYYRLRIAMFNHAVVVVRHGCTLLPPPSRTP